MKNINEIIKKNIIEIAGNPKSICVAFSGGPDSVCLLHSLNNISAEIGFTLSAVHVNHNIRDNEAKRDAAFCVDFCKRISVPIKVFDVNVPQDAQKGESIELAARRLRYEIFENIEVDYIATAHNADDSLETFLINFCRGTGLKGLTGIPNVRGRFIRPLNQVAKNDILEYLANNNLEYVIDSTNLSNDYTRNKIRNNVIPILKDISPELINVSARNIALLKSDNDFLEMETERLYKKAVCGVDSLKIDVILSAHKAISARVIALFTYNKTKRYPDNYHLNLMLGLLNKKTSKIELYNGFFAKVHKGYFYIQKIKKLSFSVETELLLKENFINQCKINKLLLKNAIDYDKIKGKLVVRTRMPSDILSPSGRGISKLVRRLQAEADIEPYLREILPIAADDLGVVWGHKIGVDKRVAVDDNSEKILVFKVNETENGGK